MFLWDPGGVRPLGRRLAPLSGVPTETPSGRAPEIVPPAYRSFRVRAAKLLAKGAVVDGALRACIGALRGTDSARSAPPPGRPGSALCGQVLKPGRRDRRAGDVDEHRRVRGAWLAQQLHPHLTRQRVALAAVARRTRGDDVVPAGAAALGLRDHVVDRQIRP